MTASNHYAQIHSLKHSTFIAAVSILLDAATTHHVAKKATRSFYTAALNSLIINSDTPIDPEVTSPHEEQLEALMQLAEDRARKHLATTMAQWAKYMMPIVSSGTIIQRI